MGGHRFAAYRIPNAGSPIDIWDRGAVSLEADLHRRDFTIHSFALNLHTGATHDPFSGLEDLLNGRLRMTSTNAFADDPLRVLRLCRFAAQLTEFHLDPATRERAQESAEALTGVASERIRTELELTLELANSGIAADLWVAMGVIPEALLQGSLSPSAGRSFQSELSRTWSIFERAAAELSATRELTSGRLALLLILLDRSGCGPAQGALESLQQQGFVTKATVRQVSQLLDSGEIPIAEPRQRWFLHRSGILWPVAVSLAAATADSQTAPGPKSASYARIVELATSWPEEIFDPPGLVSGEDLQQHLSLEPGPLLGRVLAAIRRRQIEGTITSRGRALEVAAQLRAADDLE
jgi:tRNA nucleotidyltransferase (CCA-adding enzyme)